MNKLFRKTGERGATGSGYALVVGLIAIVALTAVTTTGQTVTSLFGQVGDTVVEVTGVEMSVSPGSASAMNINGGPLPVFSNPVEFTFTNTGGQGTAILSTSLTNTDNFIINSDNCSGNKLRAGASCIVSVSATNDVNGPYAGTLRVSGGAKFADASLSGSSSGLTPASLSVDQSSVSGMDVTGPGSPATGSPVTLTFTNDGELASDVLSTSNSNATNFVISSDTCDGGLLNGGQSCSMTVTPQADSGGSLTATIEVTDSSTSASSSLSGTADGFSLFNFSSTTFNNCGQTGPSGPSLSQCRSTLNETWENDTSIYNVSGGVQIWTVPATGTYQITAAGAKGGGVNDGSQGGEGAVMRGDFTLTEGDKIHMMVGQMGGNSAPWGGGGGGGAFVVLNNSTLLIAAGGGGGQDNSCPSRTNANAVTGTTGQNGNRCNNDNHWAAGGSNGAGGYSRHGSSQCAGAGAGWLDDGDDASGNCGSGRGGHRYSNGGTGGNGACHTSDSGHVGGFGGGGGGGCGGAGGGGGYSGGGGVWATGASGGGGGSFNSGSNQSNQGGANGGHGYVTIAN
ncbi:MAG: hypothetical protein Alpg2KO_14640 [Alphaproteobacteria bacterium]